MNFIGVLEIVLGLQDALRPSREGIFGIYVFWGLYNLAEQEKEQSIKSYRMVIDSHRVHINNITHIMFFPYQYVSFS